MFLIIVLLLLISCKVMDLMWDSWLILEMSMFSITFLLMEYIHIGLFLCKQFMDPNGKCELILFLHKSLTQKMLNVHLECYNLTFTLLLILVGIGILNILMVSMLLHNKILKIKCIEELEPFEPIKSLKIKFGLNFANLKQGT